MLHCRPVTTEPVVIDSRSDGCRARVGDAADDGACAHAHLLGGDVLPLRVPRHLDRLVRPQRERRIRVRRQTPARSLHDVGTARRRRPSIYAAATVVALFALVRLRVGLNYTPQNLRLMLTIYALAALPFFTGGLVITLAISRFAVADQFCLRRRSDRRSRRLPGADSAPRPARGAGRRAVGGGRRTRRRRALCAPVQSEAIRRGRAP